MIGPKSRSRYCQVSTRLKILKRRTRRTTDRSSVGKPYMTWLIRNWLTRSDARYAFVKRCEAKTRSSVHGGRSPRSLRKKMLCRSAAKRQYERNASVTWRVRRPRTIRIALRRLLGSRPPRRLQFCPRVTDIGPTSPASPWSLVDSGGPEESDGLRPLGNHPAGGAPVAHTAPKPLDGSASPEGPRPTRPHFHLL